MDATAATAQLTNAAGFARDMHAIVDGARRRQARFLAARGLTQAAATAMDEAGRAALAADYRACWPEFCDEVQA